MRNLSDALNLELHQSAQATVLELTNDFAVALILEAKRVAHQDKADLVLSNHIEEAMEILNSKRSISVSRQLAQVVGGAFFGAFVQGFVSELSTGNTALIAIYVVLG